MTQADVWIQPVEPYLAPVGLVLTGVGKLSQYSSGAYTWTIVDRPRRKPYAEYTSSQLWQLDLPLMLDNDTGGDVESDVAAVSSWIRPTSATQQPPVLSVSGPVDQGGASRWIVMTLAWGDASVIRNRAGARVQQDLALTLVEYVSFDAGTSPVLTQQLAAVTSALGQAGVAVPDQLAAVIRQLPSLLGSAPPSVTASVTAQLAAFLAAVPTNPAGAAQIVASALPQLAQILPTLGAGRAYIVRQGDTLARIAARELGDYRAEQTVALLNGIRDPRSIVLGQRIVLP